MRRSILLTLTALGLMICGLGGTGLFAALNDVARTGTNHADTPSLPGSADLQLATYDQTSGDCGSFSDNLESGVLDAQTMMPARNFIGAFCVRNAGSRPVDVTMLAEDVADVEVSCTGDEADYGDTTCGVGAGELSAVLGISLGAANAACPAANVAGPVALAALGTGTPSDLGALDAGATDCYVVIARLLDDASAAALQQAQSDSVTWRFRFDAVAQP